MSKLASFERRAKEILQKVGDIQSEFELSSRAQDWMYCDLIEHTADALKTLLTYHYLLSANRIQQMVMTFEELMINSVYEHEKDNIIISRYRIGIRGLCIQVIESGSEGFDVSSKIEQARKNPNKLTKKMVLEHRGNPDNPQQGGVGMFCLLNFVQEFEYSHKGNKVIARLTAEEMDAIDSRGGR
ncbi:MAG: ATP-binding protein [Candidatus Peribacteraceae bacterium]|nr:ATP-binding protein [Candidatus Peribacteraceae bacterium]